MGSPQVIDVELLLTPVSPDAPSGSNLRDDVSPTSPYFRMKDTRNAARAAERRADTDGQGDALLPEWRAIREMAPKIIAERSKDLEVTAWLIEALVRSEGFAGLRDGFRLARRLVETYWDTLFSLEDEEGIPTKVAPLTGLNGQDADGTLIQPIRKVALTKHLGDGALAAYHYEQALAFSQITDPEIRARREQSGVVTLERFNAAVNVSGGPFYIGLIADIAESIVELDALARVLDERAGQASPPTSTIRNALSSVLESVRHFSRELVARENQLAEHAAASAAPANNGSGGGTEGVMASAGAIRNREDALHILLLVADYFRKYEPHSPICTTLEETVRRARLPFQELLAELLPDRTVWRTALAIAGIKAPEDS